jgi:CBS-domain-containing membrane protein
VAERVVDQLEVIDIDDQQRDRLLRGARLVDRGRRGLDEGAAQRQSREIVDTNGRTSGRSARRGIRALRVG